MSRALIATLSVVLVGPACAPKELGLPGEGLPESVVVEVVNDHFYDARIHAVYTGGQPRSLGTVAGNGGEHEESIAWEPHALVFEIDFVISGAKYVSLPLNVSRGEVVEVRIPPNIEMSGWFRRVRGG